MKYDRMYINVRKENFCRMLSKLEKLYFLILDEQNNRDFLNILLNLQKKYENDTEIFEIIEKKVQEKQKIIQKIKIIREAIEEELKNCEKNLISKVFLTFFLQKI